MSTITEVLRWTNIVVAVGAAFQMTRSIVARWPWLDASRRQQLCACLALLLAVTYRAGESLHARNPGGLGVLGISLALLYVLWAFSYRFHDDLHPPKG